MAPDVILKTPQLGVGFSEVNDFWVSTVVGFQRSITEFDDFLTPPFASGRSQQATKGVS